MVGGRCTAFPQYVRYFHKKIGVTADDFQADREYLLNQRRRNLPVGESRQGPSGGLGMGLAREPGTDLLGKLETELAREPTKEFTRHSGNWLLRYGPRKLLQRME
jgi:hypothetical protein